MTTLEAMACGLPIITNNFGGQTDYLKDEYWDKENKRIAFLDGESVPARYSAWDVGDWVRPFKHELKANMRLFYRDKIVKKAYRSVKKWTWENAAKEAIAAMEDL